MTTQEFSTAWDTLINSFGNNSVYAFDEYEKSYFLTVAQEEVVRELYNGRNPLQEGFEKTEELRRYLNELITTWKTPLSDSYYDDDISLFDNSYIVALPEDPKVMFIIYEAVKLEDDNLGCYSGTVVNLQPTTHDEYNKIKDNPFRGATKYRALRLDTVDKNNKLCVEIISKYNCSEYILRYIRRPNPIILINLDGVLGENLSINGETRETQCELNPSLHEYILEKAVDLALRSKGIGKQQQ